MNPTDVNAAGGISGGKVKPLKSVKAAPLAPPDLAAICAKLPGKYRRIPTYLAPLDALTRDGLQTNRLVAIGGPPGVTKTGLALAMAREMALKGVDTPKGHQRLVVAFIATDEPRDGLLSRLGQIEGVDRRDLENEDTDISGPAWATAGARIAEIVDLLLFDPREEGEPSTVEDAVAVAVQRATEVGGRLVVIVDSLQTAPFNCDTDADPKAREKSPREKIDGRMRALRGFTIRHQACVIVISELNRAGYSPGNEAGLSSFKESSGIEYGVDLALTLKRIKDEERFVVEVTSHKNRMGDDGAFRLERRGCTFEPAEMPDPLEPGEREAAKVAAEDAAVEAMAERLLGALVKAGAKGLRITGQRELKALVKGRNRTKQDAVSLLLASGRIEGGNGQPFVLRHEDEERSE